jgi:hypothetical protein
MTVSALIEKLEQLKAEHGDLPVVDRELQEIDNADVWQSFSNPPAYIVIESEE